MSRTRLSVSLLLLALACAPPVLAQQDISKVNGGITAQAGRPYGDVDTVNGSITIESGAIVKDAETVNGSIRAADDIRADSLSTVNGSIRVGERATVRDSVETVNGSVFVGAGGRIGGNVETVNGAIGLVDVDLAGDIETVSGDITVGVGSHVAGGIRIDKPSANWFPVQVNKRKPKIVVGPGAVVEGELKFEREVTLYVHDTARIGKVTGATAVAYSTATSPAD
jgi:hypothetical protein